MQHKKLVWIGGGIILILIVFVSIGSVVTNKNNGYNNVAVADYYRGGMASGLSAPSFAQKSSGSVSERAVFQDSSASIGTPSTDRMIIRTGSLSLIVTDVRESSRAIQTMATERGGFVVSSVIHGEDKNMSGTVSIRIPAKEFDASLSSAKGLAKKVESESVNGQDVTEEFHDIEAQLKNLRAEEEQFRTILKGAVKIEDILSVTREISRVRQQIDMVEGRKKYLEQSAALSTITVYLATDAAALPVINQEEWRPLDTAKNALRGVVTTLRALSYLLIRFAVFAIIWIPVLLIVWVARKWWMKRHHISA